MRLFTAIVPPADVLDHLAAALPPAPPGVRWTHPDTWHVTLAFHGEVAAGAVPDLTDALHTELAEVAPLTLGLSGAGLFAGRTLWIGVQGDADHLAARVRAAAGAVGLVPEARDRRRLHVTVGRATARSFAGRPPVRTRRRDAPANGSDAVVHALAVYRGPAFDVTEVHLVESLLGQGPGGTPRHLTVDRIPLRGPHG